jgi:large subunit ribosomal protein L22
VQRLVHQNLLLQSLSLKSPRQDLKMEKDKNIVKAINKNVRSSPRKINILLKNIRGKKADIAISYLSFARQRIASEIKKTVQSAIANAENNNQYDIDNLYVKEAYVGKSIVLKRFRARAKGRGARILKHFSNLTIKLKEQIEKKQKEKNIKKDHKKDMKEEKK